MDLRAIFKLTPVYDLLGKRSYAQSGEDLVVDDLLGRQGDGFYIDVGAYHPKVFSNTYLFYKRGWKGICIEPNPEMKWMHRFVRPRDIFVNCGVANLSVRSSQLEYFVFDEGATNTFSKTQRDENIKAGRKLLETKKIPVCTLAEILDRHLPKGQKIDLMSIDVEGMDLAVLKSNDWEKYRPRYLVVEDLNKTQKLENSTPKASPASNAGRVATAGWHLGWQARTQSVEEFLKNRGYRLVGLTGLSMIFGVVE